MAYDERLSERVERVLDLEEGVVQKKMFGGLAFLVKGNMALGVHKDRLMVRVGPEGYEEALGRPHCQAMDITGRPHARVRDGKAGRGVQRRRAVGVGTGGGRIRLEPA